MATLNKYNQMFGSYIDISMMAGAGMPSLYVDIGEDDTEFDEELEEMYDKYLEEKVERQIETGEEGEDFKRYATRKRKEDAKKKKIKDGLEHETVNIYAEMGIDMPYPTPTWWKFDEPDFDILDTAGESFKDMKEDLGIESVLIDRDKERLFQARYELPQYEREFKHAEAVFSGGTVIGWLDFMGGVPYGCVEKMGIAGEVFSKRMLELQGGGKVGVDGEDKPVAPVPEEFFSEANGVNLLFNKLWLGYDNVLSFTEGLSDYPKSEHDWWTRINLIKPEEEEDTDESKGNKITPGEIIGSVLWLFPNLPWGWQRTSPFMFSGNRIETVYYTSAKVLEVIDATTYLISYNNKEVEAKSSDYAIYKVGERVTILKGVEHPEDSMTWENLKDYDAELWSIIPVIFYHKEEVI